MRKCNAERLKVKEMGTDNAQTVTVAVKGRFPHPKLMQVVDDKALNAIERQITEEWKRDIVVDFEHETYKNCSRAEAAGWLKWDTVKREGDTLRGGIKWNEDAARLIRKRKFRYLSPVFEHDEKGAIVRLINMALTNNPNIHKLNPLTNEYKETPEMEHLKKIAAKLGLEEGAGAEEILAAIEKGGSQEPAADSTELDAILKMLGVESAEEARKKIAELTKPAAEPEEDVAELKNEIEELRARQARASVDSAMELGKITPNQSEWADNFAMNDLDGFNNWVDAAPVAVPLSASPAAGSGSITNGVTLTEEDRIAANSLGLSEKEFAVAKEEYLAGQSA